ncbi:MAG: delta-60 repeat domain-containing protein, partial [bacterium]
MLIAGQFTSVGGAARGRVARLNVDGTLDTSFMAGLSGADATVNAVAILGSGKVLIGGQFTSVNGTGRAGLAMLNTDGTVDTAFLSGLAGADGAVRAILLDEAN